MVDQLRQCDKCGQYRHITEYNVGWRNCFTCENEQRKLMADLGIITPDQVYAQHEEKIWSDARARGVKVDRLIN